MNFQTFIKLELKNLVASRLILTALICFALAGVYSIVHSHGVLERQRAVIAGIPAYQQDHLDKQLELNKADLGNVLYYLQHSTIHHPSSWSAFSIGQRDVNPFNVKVRMLTLEGQLYDSEFSNPNNLLFGNFDPSFVIIFLLPLLVIAFSFDLLSSDKESGIWDLIRSQPVSLITVVGTRLLLRFALLLSISIALILCSALFYGSTLDARFLYVILIAFIYLVFWFSLAAFITSLQKGSLFNALSLLGVWIFLSILAPALLNLLISSRLPVSESFDVTVRQREGYHQKWDRPKAETMQRFYEQYPQYRGFVIPEDKFSWGWYYAMQQMGDIESGNASEKYIEKLRKRNNWTDTFALFLPTVNSQIAFNNISGNDLGEHLSYLDSVRKFHSEIREFFYPHVFNGTKVSDVEWNSLPQHAFNSENSNITLSFRVFTPLILALMLLGLAFYNGKQSREIG